MPTETSPVGGLTLPLSSDGLKTKLEDPIVEALLDFSAYYIKANIDGKLTDLIGTSFDAVPASNRFSFDPAEARGHVKMPRPSLYVYWTGESRFVAHSIYYNLRIREIHMMYVYDELPQLDEMDRRIGLMNAVDASMYKMSSRRLDPAYAYPTNPLGMGIVEALGALGVADWSWMGGRPGRFGIDEGPGAERRRARRSGRDFPVLKGKWVVQERVEARTLEDPADVLGDVDFIINGSDGETTDTVEGLYSVVLPAPDGTEIITQEDGDC